MSFDPRQESDISYNKFSQLITSLFPCGLLITPGGDIFPAVIGGPAFKRVAPAQSLHIAGTFKTIEHLESRQPVKCPNDIVPMNPALLLGVMTGAGTLIAALNAVEDNTHSPVPVIGYTVPYAIGNVLLTVWGALIVNFV